MVYSWSPEGIKSELYTAIETKEKKAKNLVNAKERAKIIDKKYKFRKNLIINKAKLKDKDMTQTDLNALAESDISVYKLGLKKIMAESKRDLLIIEVEALDDKFDALKDYSNNLRQEQRNLPNTDAEGKPRI